GPRRGRDGKALLRRHRRRRCFRGARGLLEDPALARRAGGSSRQGNFLPSAQLFLQKGGNGPRTGGQHSFRARETKPFPESFFFVASTEPPALLEKRNHLARESLKPLGVNVHKHIEA